MMALQNAAWDRVAAHAQSCGRELAISDSWPIFDPSPWTDRDAAFVLSCPCATQWGGWVRGCHEGTLLALALALNSDHTFSAWGLSAAATADKVIVTHHEHAPSP